MLNGAKRSRSRPKTDVSRSFIFRPDSNFNCILYTFCTAVSSSKCRLCQSHKSQFETPNEIQASSPFRCYQSSYILLADYISNYSTSSSLTASGATLNRQRSDARQLLLTNFLRRWRKTNTGHFVTTSSTLHKRGGSHDNRCDPTCNQWTSSTAADVKTAYSTRLLFL